VRLPAIGSEEELLVSLTVVANQLTPGEGGLTSEHMKNGVLLIEAVLLTANLTIHHCPHLNHLLER